MANGQPLMHLHQFQDAHTGFDATPPQLYQQQGDPRHHRGSHHYGLQAESPLVDTAHFDDFSFPYAGIPDHSPMMALPEQGSMASSMASSLAFDDHAADHFANSQNVTTISANSIPAYATDASHRGVSISTPEESAPEKTSPIANSLEDTVADEFGLQSHARADGTDLGGRAKDDKSQPPAWSELKTKAGKDRKRLPLACIACRRKKIRCSGEKPACKHCLRSRIPCVYKVTTRKAAPRTDYMAMLDKRLKRMEERIIKIVPKSEQDPVCTVTRAVVKPAILGAQSGKPGSKKRGAEEAFGPDIEAWAKAPAAAKKTSDDKESYFPIDETEEDQLFQEGIDALPSKEIQEQLAEIFFDRIYGQAYHLLHKPSYMRKLKSNALPPVLVLSVCAVTARFTDGPEGNASIRQFLRGEEWASHARDICTKRYEWPNITILTCLLLLGLHEFGTCHGGRSWALGGQAIRMAFALQLHKDLEYDPTSRNGRTRLSFVDREIRRRIMWGCFLMDRFNSSGTDRPMFIREETLKIPLPVKERFFQLDMPVDTESLDGKVQVSRSPEDGQMSHAQAQENMGVAAYIIRSVSLWGRIITYVNQGGKEMDGFPMWEDESGYSQLVRDADSLLQSLPNSLQYSRENLEVHLTETTATQLILLHILIQQNILFLNQAAVSCSNKRVEMEVPKAFLNKASTTTFSAASRISELIRDAENTQCHISAPFAGYCAFSSTTIHILGIFSGNPALKTSSEANSSTNIKFLRKMMKYWGMFHWMVENIRTQYRDALNATRSGTGNSGTKSSMILQYGDWFNRYPHGVSDMEMMDPAMQKKKARGEDAVLEQKSELQSVEDFFTTLSPSQNTNNRDASQATRRKSASKKQSESTIRANKNFPESKAAEKPARSSREQGGIQPQPYRKFSGSQASQPLGGGVPYSNPPLTSPTHDPSYNHVASMSPISISQFAQHAPRHPPVFSTDMLLMDMGQQSNAAARPLDQQLIMGGYNMDSSGLSANQHAMTGMPGWDGLSPGHQPDNQGHIGRNLKAARLNSHHMHTSGPQMTSEVVGDYGAPDASSAWFMPYNMAPPEANPEMAGPNIDGLNIYGGLSTPNPMESLRHSL